MNTQIRYFGESLVNIKCIRMNAIMACVLMLFSIDKKADDIDLRGALLCYYGRQMIFEEERNARV